MDSKESIREEKKEEAAENECASVPQESSSASREATVSMNQREEALRGNKATKPSKRRVHGTPLITSLHFGTNAILFLLILAFAAVHCLRIIHDNYFVTIVQRARRTDEDLTDEYTYYERPCNLVDISATKEEASQLIVGPDTDEAVDKMMTHGAIMIPKILSDSMLDELRNFVVWKNDDVRGTSAEYPVTNGENRISYGIEAAEHPTVIRALKEIHDNDQLKNILEGLVGDNPALTEITAITAAYGSTYQPWHPDVKPDGNGVQFGRTYSHSYSLFIPLQNTTGEMGATDLCPGTHYCANWIDQQCEGAKIGLHELREEGVWKKGDAVLLNQQVWHRGTKHTDRNSGERILFIMSFIGRPTDTRQLARGTYFHMKWNMWGHTWQDLADAATSMASPYNILRCLHLWKPKGRAWGYDLFTSAALRIANEQLGCEPGDLQIFLDLLDKYHFPAWLDGTIDFEDGEAWQIYFRETISNLFNFLLVVNCAAVLLYILLLRIVLVPEGSGNRIFLSGFSRLCLTHGFVFGLVLFITNTIHKSQWAIGISSGKTLMRPFPPVESIWREDDPSVSKGPTTVPMRYDVLVGTRLDSKSIGAYSRWHDFHPGNRRFLKYISEYGGGMYRHHEETLPNVFHKMLIDNAMRVNERESGRFLQQDYRTGDWLLMSESETRQYIRLQLFLGRNCLLASLKKEIDFIISKYRFDFKRGTALSYISQSYMQNLEKHLFKVIPEKPSKKFSKIRTVPVIEMGATSLNPPRYLNSAKQVLLATQNYNGRKSQKRFFLQTIPNTQEDIRPSAEVFHVTKNMSGEQMVPATVLQVSKNGKGAEIAYYGEDAASFGLTKWVSVNNIVRQIRPVEGLRVRCNYFEQGEWFSGKIDQVLPTAEVDILYDDGDYEEGAWFGNCIVIS